MTLKFADNLFEYILSNRYFRKDILDHFGIDSFIISFNRCNDQTANINCRRTNEDSCLAFAKVNIRTMLVPGKNYDAPGIFSETSRGD